MKFSYNQIAGQNAERLAALSDGIFAVAMTLLLLELRVPAKELIHNESALRDALAPLLLLAYWANILALGAVLYFIWGHATKAGLVKESCLVSEKYVTPPNRKWSRSKPRMEKCHTKYRKPNANDDQRQ